MIFTGFFIPSQLPFRASGNAYAMSLSASTALAIVVMSFSADKVHADEASLTNLPAISEDRYSNGFGVSRDGSTVIGGDWDNETDQDSRAFRWTASGGTQDLGRLNGGASSRAHSTNADGSVVVGYAQDGPGGQLHAFRWTQASGTMQSLGTLPGGAYSFASDVNGDGSVVVGGANFVATNTNTMHAFRWEAGLMQDLGSLNGTNYSYASGVNFDGSVVVGDAYDGAINGNPVRAFRWTQAGGMQSLGTLGGSSSSASAVSDDGLVVVGSSNTPTDGTRAFRWTQASGMSSLGSLVGRENLQQSSGASDVNRDGSVVVGQVYIGDQANGFRWTQSTGMITVEQWLRANGSKVADNTIYDARGVSADGNVVVGTLRYGNAYIARVGPGVDGSSAGSSGIIDLQQYSTTLAAKPAASVGLGYAGTTLNGAHGEPMRNLLEAGRQSFWVTNDTGFNNGKSSDGAFGLGDVGYGIGLEGGVTARFAAGGLYTDQDIDAGGKFTQKGIYLAPEVTLPLGNSLYATVGAYYSPTKLSIQRGYLNGGVMDYSSGEADSTTWGGKVRLDWLNAVTTESWGFTPYSSLTYAHSKLDAYSETGGSFPASFNETREDSTVLRAGVDGVYALNDKVNLLTRAEAAYRFEQEAAGTSGTIIGLSGFDLAGQKIDQFWLRGGIGAEVDVGKNSTVSLNLNVTTQGSDPTMWARSGWRIKF